MPPDTETSSRSPLIEYLSVLRRRKWTLMVVLVVSIAVAVGLSESQAPTYQASAKVLVVNSPTQAFLASASPSAPPNIDDEIQRLQSPSVADLVRKQLGQAPPVSGSNLANTDIMLVTASSRAPAAAARVANAYANAYIKQRQTEVANSYLSAATVIQGQINGLEGQITGPSKPGSPAPAANPQATSLSTQVGLLQQQADSLRTEATVGTSGVQLLQPAEVPGSPASPNPVRNGLLGLGGGLVIGIALAFGRERLDDTLATKEDLDVAQPGLPVLGLIPAVPSWRDRTQTDLVTVTRPQSATAESYRSLRTSVQFLSLDQSLRTLQVTSPKSSEGKTTTVANLAVALAGAGQRVAVVCCDLRRPRIHHFFGLSNDTGLTSVLAGELPLSEALQEIPGQAGLVLLASGPRPSNPSELLSSPRTAEVLSALSEMADLVLIDTPPILPVTDAVVLSPRMDATLVVVSSGITTRRDLARSLELLSQVEAPLAGAVLNGIVTEHGYGYRYGANRHSYYHGGEPEPVRQDRGTGAGARAR